MYDSRLTEVKAQGVAVRPVGFFTKPGRSYECIPPPPPEDGVVFVFFFFKRTLNVYYGFLAVYSIAFNVIVSRFDCDEEGTVY